MLLHEFENREKDGVHGARASHGYSEPAVHVSFKEFNLWGRLDLLPLGVQERVSLVNALCRIDGVDHCPGYYPAKTPRDDNG